MPSSLFLFSLLALSTLVASQLPDPVKEAKMATFFKLQVYHKDQLEVRLRGIKRLSNGDVLVVKAGGRYVNSGDSDESGVLLLKDSNLNGVAGDPVEIIPSGFRLSHGIEYVSSWPGDTKGRILASNEYQVWAWPWNEGDLETGAPELIISNVNATSDQMPSEDRGQGHWTRTLRLSPDERHLYVSVGSVDNVDPDSFRSRVRVIDLQSDSFVNNLPLNYIDATVFADGLRNTISTAFDAKGVMWGGDTGADQLNRADLGGDIHNDNPGEELNKFDMNPENFGKNYGYPYCWSEYKLETYGQGNGTLWAWPDSGVDDDWCRQNTEPSQLVMQAHATPLGLTFYNTSNSPVDGCPSGSAFPSSMNGDAFIAFHGSWNRDVPVGYSVVHIPFTEPGGVPKGGVYNLMRHNGAAAKWPSNVRPVDVTFDICGRLLVTDDGASRVYTISYNEPEQEDPALRPIWYILIGYNAFAIFLCFVAILYAHIKHNREY